MSDKLKTFSSVILLIGVIGLIVFLGLFIVNKMDSQIESYYQRTCMDMNNAKTNPQLVTYSGCNCGSFVSCDNCHKAGTFCILENGSEIDITIRNVSNGVDYVG